MPKAGPPLEAAVQDARKVAHDTNKRVKDVQATTPRRFSLPQRAAALGLVILVIYLVTLSFTQSRSNGAAISNQGKSLKTITTDNKTLVDVTARQGKTIDQLVRERGALLAIIVRQDQILRDNGLPGVDPFDPAQNGGVVLTTPSPRPGTIQPKPSKGSLSPQSPAPSPAPSSRPSVAPSPQQSPLATVCVPPIRCISAPPLPRLLPSPIVRSSTGNNGSIARFTLSTKETTVDPINFMSYDATTVARLLGLVVPLLVAAITKRYASAGLKGVLNLIASAVVGSATYLVSKSGDYDFTGFVNATLNTFIVSVVAYYSLLKPTGLTDKISSLMPSTGLGSNTPGTTIVEGTLTADKIVAGTITETPKKKATKRVKKV